MKRKSREKREFIKQRKTLKRLTWILFGFLLILAHIVAFSAVSGKSFTLANAAEVVTLNQAIRPLNPVEKTSPLVSENKKTVSLNSSTFRLITPLNSNKTDSPPPESQKIKTAPIVTFSGVSVYPNSVVFLDVHSTRFFSSTLSDDQGHWNWSNYGQPLEPGDHTIEAYSIAPVELAGSRDVLAQKYFFTVAENDPAGSNFVSLGNSNYNEKGGSDDLADRIRENNLSDTYVFQAALPNKTEYSFGDNMNLELLFTPLDKNAKNEASINYAIYAMDESGNVDRNPAAEFSDNASLDGGGYFLKNIKLNENLMPGGYVMKIISRIGSDDYFQSVKFNLSSKAFMTIGSNVITVEKFGQTMVFNIIFIVVVLIVLISLVIVEFRRFMVYRPIDEDFLKRKGYFTK